MSHAHDHSPHSSKHIGKNARWDYAVYVVTLCSLVITFDQVRIIFVSKSSTGVSLATWAFYLVSALVWFMYGFVHKDKTMMYTNSAWVLMNLLVIGSIMHFS